MEHFEVERLGLANRCCNEVTHNYYILHVQPMSPDVQDMQLQVPAKKRI
jgi:hypothetical protein